MLLTLFSDVKATDDETMETSSTGSSPFVILTVSSATGLPKEMVGSAGGVSGQGPVLYPSVAAVRTGPNSRAPFSSSTRTLVGFAAGWTYLIKNEMQDFSSESSRTGRSYELLIPGTLEGRTWVKGALSLSLFVGLVRQSASLWIVVLLYEHNIYSPPLCCYCPFGFG